MSDDHDTTHTGQQQNGLENANIIPSLPNAHSAGIQASAHLVREENENGIQRTCWIDALGLKARGLSRHMRRGQWQLRTFEPTGNDLKDLLGEYSLVMVGGKARVMRWRKELLPDGSERDALELVGKEDFKTFHSDKIVEIRTASRAGSTVQIIPATEQFFLDAKRHSGLVYLPHQGPEPAGFINLWRGFGVMPKKGSWQRMRDHIFEVVSDSSEEVALYIIKWCAWLVQNPGHAAEVAIVLKGREGVGKGVFVQALLRIFGIHGLQISDRGHLIGKFNKHLMHTSLLFADEAFWAGDRQGEGVLKRLITEQTLTIEPKGLDTFSVSNCLHMIMASNEDWVIPAGVDARRFAVLEVNPSRKGDDAYFQRLWEEVKGDGPSAMLYDLLSVDLQGWHPRQSVPQTDALRQQKLLSMKGVDRLVYLLANEGKLPCLAVLSNPAAVVTSGEGHGTGFISWAKRQIRSLSHMTGPKIKKTLRDEWNCELFSRNGLRGLDFPRLIDLRQKFEERYGPQDWENPEQEDWEVNPRLIGGDKPALGAKRLL